MLEIKSQHLTWVIFVWSHFDYKTLIRRYLNFFLKNVGFIIFVANCQITFHLYYFRALCIVAKPFRKIFATDLWKISTKKMSVKYSLNLNCWPKYFNNEMYFYIHSKRKKRINFSSSPSIYGFPKLNYFGSFDSHCVPCSIITTTTHLQSWSSEN